MDIVDLWELLSYVDDWSFETFPWDVFSLCRTTLQTDQVILPDSSPKNDGSCLLSGNSVIQNGESSDFGLKSAELPNADVPSDQNSHINNSIEDSGCGNQKTTSSSQDLVKSELTKTPVIEDACTDIAPSDSSSNSEPELQSLEESILSLRQSLENRTALAAFEKLTKKSGAPTDVAKLSENAQKNRYKDVLPYDDSRVPLTESKSGDYINASFVTMEIPPLNLHNEYIAAQGPLPHTCDDFWQMIWEQNCCIIVMVTTLRERNRVKCHKYWPDLYEMVTFAGIQITCFHETTSQAGITRDLLLVNKEANENLKYHLVALLYGILSKMSPDTVVRSGAHTAGDAANGSRELLCRTQKDEERHIIQMQYVTWPDHGVPDDATDFLEFVQQLREWRKLIGGITIVHCSAGVGRTGVCILMETAMCLIESNNPVYPLQLVKTMRDQRMMMVQTVGQYKFICEAILKLYSDHESSTSATSGSR